MHHWQSTLFISGPQNNRTTRGSPRIQWLQRVLCPPVPKTSTENFAFCRCPRNKWTGRSKSKEQYPGETLMSRIRKDRKERRLSTLTFCMFFIILQYNKYCHDWQDYYSPGNNALVEEEPASKLRLVDWSTTLSARSQCFAFPTSNRSRTSSLNSCLSISPDLMANTNQRIHWEKTQEINEMHTGSWNYRFRKVRNVNTQNFTVGFTFA